MIKTTDMPFWGIQLWTACMNVTNNNNIYNNNYIIKFSSNFLKWKLENKKKIPVTKDEQSNYNTNYTNEDTQTTAHDNWQKK